MLVFPSFNFKLFSILNSAKYKLNEIKSFLWCICIEVKSGLELLLCQGCIVCMVQVTDLKRNVRAAWKYQERSRGWRGAGAVTVIKFDTFWSFCFMICDVKRFYIKCHILISLVIKCHFSFKSLNLVRVWKSKSFPKTYCWAINIHWHALIFLKLYWFLR